MTHLSDEERSKLYHELAPVLDGSTAAYTLRADHESLSSRVRELEAALEEIAMRRTGLQPCPRCGCYGFHSNKCLPNFAAATLASLSEGR